MPGYPKPDGPEFSRTVTLGEAYRIMLRFLTDYHDRADSSVSDLLYAYACISPDGTTTDPAAAEDFLKAAKAIEDARADDDDVRAR